MDSPKPTTLLCVSPDGRRAFSADDMAEGAVAFYREKGWRVVPLAEHVAEQGEQIADEVWKGTVAAFARAAVASVRDNGDDTPPPRLKLV